MNPREWFERFMIWFKSDMDEFCDPAQLIEERKTHESALMRMAVEFLPLLEKKVIQSTFYQGLTVRETAEKLGLAKSTVQDIKKRALRILSKSNIVRLAFLPARLKDRMGA